jgi:hypothetical protein
VLKLETGLRYTAAMADVAMRRFGRTLVYGAVSAMMVASCGGDSKTDVNDAVETGGKSSSTGGRATGGAATGGAKANGGTVSTFGGSPILAGAPSGSGGASTGGSKATGGEATASGGSESGGEASTSGGEASTSGGEASTSGGSAPTGGSTSAMGGRASGEAGAPSGGSGGREEIPDDSCTEGCEVAPQTPLCGEERFTWVCFGTGSQVFNTPECQDAGTQVPRFCCSKDFRPCE